MKSVQTSIKDLRHLSDEDRLQLPDRRRAATAAARLFEPVRIGRMELKNRLIMPAATTYYDFEEGGRDVNFLAARARGGVALIVIGALQVLYPGKRADIGKVNIYDDGDVPRLRERVNVIHAHGCKAAAQLAVYGYWSKKGREGTAEDVAPSEVEIPRTGLHPAFERADFLPRSRALGVEEIRQILGAVGDAAARARDASFDAIELQAVGGNLFCRFINPFTNRRTDQYGGSLKNRARLLLEAVAAVKRRVGADFPLMCRIPGDDMLPWGIGIDTWQEVATLLEKAGVHALSIYPGWHETRAPRQQMSVPRGYFVGLAASIKQRVRIPVVANMRINDPLLAAKIIERGEADLVAMATPLIADPDLPNKARDGRFEDIRMCTACLKCWDDLIQEVPIRCSVNAQAGKEGERRIVPAKDKKRVLVVGAGPGGMEAARVAALRGHRVTLMEKAGSLGGQLRQVVAGLHKDEWNNLTVFLTRQIEKLGVEVRLNEEATVEAVQEHRPDAVIVATGSEPVFPKIPGISGASVLDSHAVLTGARPVGNNVVIVGGGATACEVGEFLEAKGKRVTILEMQPVIGADIGPKNRWVIIDRMAQARIRMEAGATVTGITKKGVTIVRKGKYHEFFEADTVVVAVGMKAVDTLANSLEGKVPELVRVGDCVRPGDIRKAIEDGFLAGTQV